MIRSVAPRLYDIDVNIALIQDLTAQRTQAHYENDPALRYAVNFAVLIIAEAVGKLPEELTGHHPDVPWRRIAGIGNRIRHEYFRIDPEIMWDVVINHLPKLQQAVSELVDAFQSTDV